MIFLDVLLDSPIVELVRGHYSMPITFILWVLYTLIEGFRGGFYWYFRDNTIDDCIYEIKSSFSIQRIVVLLLIFINNIDHLGLILSIWYCVSLYFIFLYVHYCSYISTRNGLNNVDYKLRVSDYRDGLSSFARLCFMIIGIVSCIFIYINH